MSGLYQKRRRRPEINLVPLIDVLVMLIFFAFVTMQFKSVATMNLTLPKAESAGKNEIKQSITISITKDGQYFLNNQTVSEKELEPLLQKLPGLAKDITVLIRADEKTQLQNAITAMDICRKNGLNNIRLQTQ
jgi:biopolymer transport protein ExbD